MRTSSYLPPLPQSLTLAVLPLAMAGMFTSLALAQPELEATEAPGSAANRASEAAAAADIRETPPSGANVDATATEARAEARRRRPRRRSGAQEVEAPSGSAQAPAEPPAAAGAPTPPAGAAAASTLPDAAPEEEADARTDAHTDSGDGDTQDAEVPTLPEPPAPIDQVIVLDANRENDGVQPTPLEVVGTILFVLAMGGVGALIGWLRRSSA